MSDAGAERRSVAGRRARQRRERRGHSRLAELLLGFGAAGRQSVEQLKNSPNPAVRRTAINLLRVFGGQEALPELASMLDDADPQVQRESIRAIVQIGTNNAYAVLHRLLLEADTPRDTVLQQLIGLRDDKAAPLLCYVLTKAPADAESSSRMHITMIEALGTLGRTRNRSARCSRSSTRAMVGAVSHDRAAAGRGRRAPRTRHAGGARPFSRKPPPTAAAAVRRTRGRTSRSPPREQETT